jgi:hypothetical protein
MSTSIKNRVGIKKLNAGLSDCVTFAGEKQNHQNQVKKYCSIGTHSGSLFLLLFSILFLSNRAKGISFVDPAHSSYISVRDNAFCSAIRPGMNENTPHNDYVVILFKKGIEGKSKFFSFKANVHSVNIKTCFTSYSLSNAGWINYILSVSKIHVLPQELIPSLSHRGPPILC